MGLEILAINRWFILEKDGNLYILTWEDFHTWPTNGYKLVDWFKASCRQVASKKAYARQRNRNEQE